MNILLSMPDDKTANYYIINALQALGHTVYFTNHRMNLSSSQQYVNSLTQTKKIDYMIVAHFPNGQTYDLHFLEMFKINHPEVKLVSLLFDVYIDGKVTWENPRFIELMKQFDFSFFVTPTDVENLRPLGVNAYEMFFGFDDSMLVYPEITKDIDISFIGQFGWQNNVAHLGRLAYLDRICKEFEYVEIYGNCGSITPAIEKKFIGRGTYNDREYSRIVARSKISFGYSDFGVGVPLYSYSNRVVHTLGFGGFLMHNRIPILERDFIENAELVLYDNIDDCIEKMQLYLDRSIERDKVANFGHYRVIRDYTWKKSWLKIFSIMER